ncbi:MAG: hypothetical protein ACLQVY_18030 [Limisphaerales bacterium]
MRIGRPFLELLTAFILGFGPVTGYSGIETYYYSGPITGFTGVDLTPEGLGSGGFSASFGTVSETLYYDPVASLLEQVGSVTLNSSSKFFNIQSPFFLPSESGSATLTVGNNGNFSFDITGSITGSDCLAQLLVPVSGSGTFNNQPFSGSWNIDIPMVTDLIAATPTSLTFSQSALEGAQQGQNVIPGTDLKDAADDGTYYYSWQSADAVATTVPDPAMPAMNAMLLLPFGASAFRRCRKLLSAC